MKTLYAGTGLLFAGLLVIGALLAFFDIPPGQLMVLMGESNTEVKVIALSGLVLIAAGCLLLISWIVSGGKRE